MYETCSKLILEIFFDVKKIIDAKSASSWHV